MQVTLKGAGGSAGSRGTAAPAGTAEHQHQLRHRAPGACPSSAESRLLLPCTSTGTFQGNKDCLFVTRHHLILLRKANTQPHLR